LLISLLPHCSNPIIPTACPPKTPRKARLAQPLSLPSLSFRKSHPGSAPPHGNRTRAVPCPASGPASQQPRPGYERTVDKTRKKKARPRERSRREVGRCTRAGNQALLLLQPHLRWGETMWKRSVFVTRDLFGYIAGGRELMADVGWMRKAERSKPARTGLMPSFFSSRCSQYP
jgi:hypothetical protein